VRRCLALLLAPLLLSAADPVTTARQEVASAAAEQRRLEKAADSARTAAEKAAAASALAAQNLLAIDARIALGEAQLTDLRRRQDAAEARLAEARRPASALLGGLIEAGRRPAWLALASSGSAAEQVRLAVLVRSLAPEVRRRSAALEGEVTAIAALQQQQRIIQDQLASERRNSAEAQQRFAAREKAALAEADSQGAAAFLAGDVVLDRTERAAALAGDAARRRAALSLASELATLPAAAPRPLPGDGRAPPAPFSWQVPASGAVTEGLGELSDTGVRSRGLTIAATVGTQVTAPARGTIAFAGPFRRRAGVVIVDHGEGWLTLLSGVRPGVRVGDQVEAGASLGRALGPVTAELFHSGTPQPAALIARSSGPLLSGGANR
jgi:septal ring factor EnvC (AmiA/AmiB activator)